MPYPNLNPGLPWTLAQPKLDHGADILKKTISRSKQLGGYDDSDTDSAEGDIKGGGGGHNDTSVSIKRWTHAGLGLERLLESAESQALELENILIEDHNNVNGATSDPSNCHGSGGLNLPIVALRLVRWCRIFPWRRCDWSDGVEYSH
jgi:hypothetical protein